MSEKITVKVLSDDIVLRDPDTKQRITSEGTKVKKSAFWLRRIKAGDCVLVGDTSEKQEVKAVVVETKDSKKKITNTEGGD